MDVDCVDTAICDDTQAEFNSPFSTTNPISCPVLSKSVLNTEEISVHCVADIIDCESGDSSSESYKLQWNSLIEDNSGYPYHDKTFFVGNYNINCSDSGWNWGHYACFVTDLHSEFDDPLWTQYSTEDGGSCPTTGITITPSGYVTDLTSSNDFKVFEPYSEDIAQITEASFEPISAWIMVDYFTQNEDSSRSGQQQYINNICSSDGFTPNMCHNLATTTSSKTEFNSKLLYETSHTTETSTSFGSSYTLSTNLKETLKYHFKNTKTPIYIRTKINWVYYDWNGGSPIADSFSGYHYAFVILGMKDIGSGNYQYWIQYPDGKKFLWSETTLSTRWGGNNYDGFYTSINAPVDIDYEIRHNDESTITDDIIGLSGNYYGCIDESNSNWYYETDDPLGRAYINGAWTSWQDLSIDECFPTLLPTNSVGLKNYIIQTKSKGGTTSVFRYYTVVDVNSSSHTYSPFPMYYNNTEIILEWETNIKTNTYCNITNLNGTHFVEDSDSSLVYSHTCDLNLISMGSPIFSPGESVYVSFKSQDYQFVIEDQLSPPSFANYPLNWNPSVPSQCVIGQPCVVYDNYQNTNLGSYESFGYSPFNCSGLCIIGYRLTSQFYFPYEVNFIGEPPVTTYYYGSNPNADYEYDSLNWALSWNTTYSEVGNYDVELCLTTNIEDEVCETHQIEVKENFGGGNGGGGTSETEDSSSQCSFDLYFDVDTLGDCQKHMFRHYWYDVDSDGNWESIASSNPLTYSPNNDCTDGNCEITLDRTSLHSSDSCNINKELVTNTNTLSDTIDLYLCYDNSLWNDCHCSVNDTIFSEWISFWGYSSSSCSSSTYIDETNPGGERVCGDIIAWSTDSTFSNKYNICDSNYIYNNVTGLWCSPIEVEIDCEYNCSKHDFDNDGVNDCLDVCCGGDDTIDSDGDGEADFCDICPNDFDNDGDNDGICGDVDNCEFTSNPSQTNSDSDGFGDACDNCELTSNPSQTNSDSDGFGDACDNCEFTSNPSQTNSDSDGFGDACDNCPAVSNSNQSNLDSDSFGDVCDVCPSTSDHSDFDNDTFPDCDGTCSNGILDISIGETDIDYGGVCGDCSDGLLNGGFTDNQETEIDYGGRCGNCSDGFLSERLGETEIDYGGSCGSCSDGVLSFRINETDIDYGGYCGSCIDNSTKSEDKIWNIIPLKVYPFSRNQCETGQSIIVFISATILIILLLILLLIILIVWFLMSFILRGVIFLGRKAFKKINDKEKKENYK